MKGVLTGGRKKGCYLVGRNVENPAVLPVFNERATQQQLGQPWRRRLGVVQIVAHQPQRHRPRDGRAPPRLASYRTSHTAPEIGALGNLGQ